MSAGSRNRCIATEEAFLIPELVEAMDRLVRASAGYDPDPYFWRRASDSKVLSARLLDLDEERRAIMDANRVDVQVLSLAAPGVQMLKSAEAVALARVANDRLAEAVARHPDRYAGLGVPLYIHPRAPAPAMAAAYRPYTLEHAIWGFQAEAGLHGLRLIVSGIFDQLPGLTIVLGHGGEGLPYWISRIDTMHRQFQVPQRPQLARRPSARVCCMRARSGCSKSRRPRLRRPAKDYTILHTICPGGRCPCQPRPTCLPSVFRPTAIP